MITKGFDGRILDGSNDSGSINMRRLVSNLNCRVAASSSG